MNIAMRHLLVAIPPQGTSIDDLREDLPGFDLDVLSEALRLGYVREVIYSIDETTGSEFPEAPDIAYRLTPLGAELIGRDPNAYD